LLDNGSHCQIEATGELAMRGEVQLRPGLRERKRPRTLSEIQRVALDLFGRQGYEATTIEQIAEEAEVSPSTVFRYFPTKEDLVLNDEYDPLLLAAIGAGPPGESPVTAVRRALLEILGGPDRRRGPIFEDMFSRGRLMMSVPELRARLWDSLHQNERALCEALAAKSGRAPDDFELRVAVSATIGGLMTALTDWIESDGRADVIDLLDRALGLLESGIGGMGAAGP
jgi:AcrR family transcriptional regulator